MADGSSLSSLVRRGAAWSTLDVAVNRAASFALGVVVARLLSPSDLGVYAIAIVVHAIIINVNELGVSTALVRGDDKFVRAAAPTVATIALVSSVVLGALMALMAPEFASLLGSPHATSVIQVMAITLPLAGVSAVPSALLRRNFRMDKLFIAGVANTCATAVVVVVLALAHQGPLALAWSFVAGQVLSSAVIIAYSPAHYRPGWDRRQARELFGFGLPLAGANVLGFSIQNVDYIVVGRVLGPEALGLYMLAFNISGWPQSVISAVIRSVSLPAFSRLHSEGREMSEQFIKALYIVSRITFPVCLFLAALATPLVQAVYGHQWTSAGSALVGLGFLAAMRTIMEVFSDFLVSIGRTRPVLLVQVLWLPVLTVALLIATGRWGINGTGAAHAAVAGLVVVPAFAYGSHRAGVSYRRVLRTLVPTFCWAGVTASIAWTVASQIADPLLACAAGGAIGLSVYLLPYLPEARKMLNDRRTRGPADATPAPEPA